MDEKIKECSECGNVEVRGHDQECSHVDDDYYESIAAESARERANPIIRRNDLKKLNVCFASSIATLIEAIGMHWENQDRLQIGERIVYGEESFNKLLLKVDCCYNTTTTR